MGIAGWATILFASENRRKSRGYGVFCCTTCLVACKKKLWNCIIFVIFYPEPARDYNVSNKMLIKFYCEDMY